jgi:hypothetical protein
LWYGAWVANLQHQNQEFFALSKLNITFRKEVSVDLNEYYPNFPSSLRKQIDDTLFVLLGGQQRQRAIRSDAGKPKSKPLGTIAIAAKDVVIVKRTDKVISKPNSKTGKGIAMYEAGKEYMAEEVTKHVQKFTGINSLHSLLRDGYFEVVR